MREPVMKRQIAAGLAIVAVVTSVGWRLASRPETSARLQDVGLKQHSEHSHPGPSDALAGIRIRLSGSDLGHEMGADHKVPQVPLAE
jgi:hypothetical protein